MPRCLGASGSVRAMQDHPVGAVLGAGGPDLLAVDHVVVAVARRRASGARRGRSRRPARRSPGTRRARRRACGAGARCFCSSVPCTISVGPAQPMPMPPPGLGARASAISSLQDELLDDGEAGAAVLLRPVGGGPAALGQLLRPAAAHIAVVLHTHAAGHAAAAEHGAARGGPPQLLRAFVLDEGADFLPKCGLRR